MKKIIKYLLLLLFIIPTNCFAASGLIDIYSSSKSLSPGNTFTVTVYCKSSSPIGTCEYTLSYDSSKVKLTSGNANVLDYVSNNKTYSLSKEFTFKAIANGSATISAKAYGMIGFDEKNMSTSVSPVTVNISTPKPSAPVTYSNNNNLKSLSVEGYKLEKAFNKNTLEYKVNVPSNVEKITINATKEDSNASVSGVGTFNVSEGDNTFKIVVTSEKGTTKTYKLIVKVLDESPINVNIDNETYTVIKRKSTLKKPDNYEETTVNINGFDIPALFNEVTNYTLVGLKDNSGNVNLYIFDSNTNSYTLFNELSFNSLKLNIIDQKPIIDTLKKEKVTINDKEIQAYKLNDNYYLIYGKNSFNGKNNWYLYEQTENTVQLFNQKMLLEKDQKIENANKLIIIFSGATLVLAVLLVIVSISKNKKDNIINNNFLEDDTPVKNKNKESKTSKKEDKDKSKNKEKDEIIILDDNKSKNMSKAKKASHDDFKDI